MPGAESDTTLQHDIDEVDEQVRDAQRDIEVNKWWIRFSLTTSLISSILIAGIFIYSLYADLIEEKIWQLAASIGAAAVFLAIWISYLMVLIRRLKRERELYRKIFRCRASRKILISRMTQSGDLVILRNYHSSILSDIEEYRSKAGKFRRIHNFYQTLVIIGSIITTSVTSAAGQFEVLRAVAPIIALTVGISAGMSGYFKHKERSMNSQQAADDIEHEHTAVELGIYEYKRKSDDDLIPSYARFAEKVERIKDEQRKREQQLEQPPDKNQQS
ncbi:DUF4231 domain-containing protein [Glycomyces dulcitolivorans]|uniref:DUF4231 domain-containing protein n=1 Tax=Glycomyces dulcitolivorans TaxID=2200759 RepID=UPI0038CC131A